MKIENKYLCDDCEKEMNKVNKYGLHNVCDGCEPQYHTQEHLLSLSEQQEE